MNKTKQTVKFKGSPKIKRKTVKGILLHQKTLCILLNCIFCESVFFASVLGPNFCPANASSELLRVSLKRYFALCRLFPSSAHLWCRRQAPLYSGHTVLIGSLGPTLLRVTCSHIATSLGASIFETHCPHRFPRPHSVSSSCNLLTCNSCLPRSRFETHCPQPSKPICLSSTIASSDEAHLSSYPDSYKGRERLQKREQKLNTI